jgi:hypothetical protein
MLPNLERQLALAKEHAKITADAYANMMSVETARSLASQFGPFNNALQHLGSSALESFAKTITPILKPLAGIFKQMEIQLEALRPVMAPMFAASIPFIKTFVDLMFKAGAILMPAFTQAMNQMVKSGALKLMAQALIILIKGLAGFIVNLGPGMKSSAEIFKGVAVVINAVLRGLGVAFAYMANTFMDNSHKIRLEIHHIASMFDDFRHRTAVVFDGIRHEVAHIWDVLWQNVVGRQIRGYQDVSRWISNLWHNIASIFDRIRHTVAQDWDIIWNNTVGRVRRGITDVANWFRSLPFRILGSMMRASAVLVGWGKGVIQGLLNGMTSIIGQVWKFIKGIPGKILSFLGIKSPPAWAIDAGKHIMNGIGIGMGQARGVLGKATSAFARLVTGKGEGVSRWIPLIQRALKMEGLDPGLLRNVLIQMQSESGGNPNAINNWDYNATVLHDPSRGLMQVIMSTFRAFHWPGTSWNIYDPLANIAAALNYARLRYGPTLMTGGMGIGSGHGYAAGGPGTGGWKWVGEHGRELLRLPPSSRVFSHADSEGMAGGGIAHVVLEICGGQSDFDKFMTNWLKDNVKILGGGNVQVAFGHRGR